MQKVTAIITRDKCHPDLCQHECMKFDPLNRAGKQVGFHLNEIHGKAEIDESLVTEMHKVSANKCPFSAIKIVKLPQELKEAPIHKYGENLFRLYKLPIPEKGKVTGIIGRNGIGKTTAMEILASLLMPNLGNYKKECSYKEIIQHFRGSELQNYFEQLSKNNIKVAYKLQKVDEIPEKYKGKVVDLLKKIDNSNKLQEIAKKLEIDSILKNDIKAISGGELQRVAIAATLLKKADLYIFDEPTSYLDIKQRLKVSQIIKDLSKNSAVLVVEHDLIVLDDISDIVHLMFGEETAYGITSLPKTQKTGINAYLDGYIKEMNIKFRDKPIKFLAKPPLKKDRSQLLTSWPDLAKTLDSFKLNIKEGEIFQGEVIGIIGPNGIGKTTFVKLLAKELEPDKGKVDLKLKISYKPQYIIPKKGKVKDFLKNALRYKAELINPLHLDSLIDSDIETLSGGELQRVYIARCLSDDADLFLLDEPSAYLDVEQRLAVSKAIRDIIELKGKSALIVDHDLLFIDYLSEKLIVFDGIPAKKGNAGKITSMEEGMNHFLKELNITMRRDKESNRPRVNKLGSQLDQEQKAENKLYYT